MGLLQSLFGSSEEEIDEVEECDHDYEFQGMKTDHIGPRGRKMVAGDMETYPLHQVLSTDDGVLFVDIEVKKHKVCKHCDNTSYEFVRKERHYIETRVEEL